MTGFMTLLIFIALYTLPPAIFASAMLRLFLGWYEERGRIVTAIFATLPQMVIVLIGLEAPYPVFSLYFSLALTLGGVIMLWTGSRSHHGNYLMLEGGFLLGITWILLSGAPQAAG